MPTARTAAALGTPPDPSADTVTSRPQVPVFKAVDVADAPVDYTGLARGGQQVTKARQTFSACVDTLIQLATLQTSFLILADAQCSQKVIALR